jgi:hypothetical protein
MESDFGQSPARGDTAAAAGTIDFKKRSLMCGLARIWWKSCDGPADSPAVGLTTAVTLGATLVVIPENVPHLQVILLPALLWLWFESDAARRTALTRVL